MKQDYLGGNLPLYWEKSPSGDLVRVRRGGWVFSKVSGPEMDTFSHCTLFLEDMKHAISAR